MNYFRITFHGKVKGDEFALAESAKQEGTALILRGNTGEKIATILKWESCIRMNDVGTIRFIKPPTVEDRLKSLEDSLAIVNAENIVLKQKIESYTQTEVNYEERM